MRVAAIQMKANSDKRANLAEAHHWFQEALKQDPNCIAFPENFSFFTDHREEFIAGAEKINGPTISTLQEWAAENDVWIVGGSVPIQNAKGAARASPKKKAGPPTITNTCVLIDPEGEIHSRYDKIHLFDVDLKADRAYRESDTVVAGKKAVVADTPWGNLGLSICYDIRFPELYRRQADKDVHVIFIPAAFTALTGKAHWDVLTRARAIENQAFVVAPAQYGKPFEGRECHGHTRIIDPWGRVLAERADGPGVVWADLMKDALEKPRAELPALKSRKPKSFWK
ncbi:MAG: carbon-nitrogen hydrolase family protein [Bdellovibrionales bacterium]|nr:carbon-nitrogen hydrolase family protein [Bdellovibrionales bacterium]